MSDAPVPRNHVQRLEPLMLEMYLTCLNSALLVASKVLVHKTSGLQSPATVSAGVLLLLLLPPTSASCHILWAGSEISWWDLRIPVQTS